MIKFSFPKELRLLTSAHFAYVFQKPKRINMTQITVFSRLNSLGKPRVGLSISKKSVKRAHERNRIKRLIRENFRLLQHELPSMDFIVVVKKGISDLDNFTIAKVLKNLWHHHCRLSLKS